MTAVVGLINAVNQLILLLDAMLAWYMLSPLCLSVCQSIRNKPLLYQNGSI